MAYKNLDNLYEVTLSLDTDAYADGDVLADTQSIANVFAEAQGGGTAILNSIVLLDKDDQGQALDLVFLRTNVSIGTENSAVSVSDANADEIVAVVEIAADDYVDLVNSQIAVKGPGDLGQILKPDDDPNLYIAAISRGTGTYTASGITLKVGVLKS